MVGGEGNEVACLCLVGWRLPMLGTGTTPREEGSEPHGYWEQGVVL